MDGPSFTTGFTSHLHARAGLLLQVLFRASGLLALKAFGLIRLSEGFHHLVDVALHDAVEAIDRQVDAVVAEAALREVIRADLLAPVAAAICDRRFACSNASRRSFSI